MRNKFKKNIKTKFKSKDTKSGGVDNKTKIRKIILAQLLLTLFTLYNIPIKVFKIVWAKGVLLTKKGFGNKWFFNSKSGYYITGCKDWLINFKKLLSGHLMDTIIGEVIKVEKIGNIQLNTIINRNLDIILLINIYYYPGLDVNLMLFNKFKWNDI